MNDWRRLLLTEADEAEVEAIRRHGRTGRPLGDLDFVLGLEKRLGRRLRRLSPGPKPERRRS